MAALDQTVVSTALPRMVADLRGLRLFSWVFTAYMLSSTAAMPLVGKLSDLYGRKRLFMLGVAIFMVTSVFAATSQSMIQLIAARGIQGLGAGLIMASTFATVGDLFSPAERGKYLGLFSGVFALASIVGPTAGGALTDHLSWRWVFYINVPVGAVALAAISTAFPAVRPLRSRPPVDYLGVAALTATVVSLLLALVWGGDQYGWSSSPIITLLALTAAFTGLFLLAEKRAADPVLPLELFRNRVFAVGTALSFLVGVGMFAPIAFIPWFVQGVLGKTATNSGLILMPMTAGMVVTSILGGQLTARTGRYKLLILAGAAVMAAGMFLFTRMDEATGNSTLTRNMVVAGAGFGLTLPILNLVMQNAVPYRQLGVATAAAQFFRQIGGMLGIAVFGTLISARLSSALDALDPAVRSQVPPPLLEPLQDPEVLLSPSALQRAEEGFSALGSQGPDLFRAVTDTLRAGLSDGILLVFSAGVVVALVLLALTLLLREQPLRAHVLSDEELEEPAAEPASPVSAIHRPAEAGSQDGRPSLSPRPLPGGGPHAPRG